MKEAVLDHAEALAKALGRTVSISEAFVLHFVLNDLPESASRQGQSVLKQVSTARSALAAYRSAEVVVVKPLAWVFELAKARNMTTGEYVNWGEPRLSFDKPCAPEGSIRNLRPLYATPAVAGTEPAGEVVDARLCKLRFFRDLIESERVKVYKVFGVLPSDFDERLNHGIESKLFKHLVAALRDQSEA